MLKKTKQQILAFVLRQGKRFKGDKTYLTKANVKWLKSLELDDVAKETLTEYLITYEYLVDKIERLDKRIEEMVSGERYCETVNNMSCLLGVKTHTALALLVEVGDFERFATARQFSGFLGLVPSESSSAGDINRFGITKAGNRHLRRLLVEAAQSYTRGNIGHKPIALKKRQECCAPEIIAYADKTSERLRRRFYRLTLSKGIHRNKVTTAIAREL